MLNIEGASADIPSPLTVQLLGEPQGKGRARAFRRGNFIGHYTPEKTRSYEGMIRFAAEQAMNGRARFDGPVCVQLTAVFSIPKSFSRRKTLAAIAGDVKPTKKPDIDNIIKAWVDAMNGVVFRDDSQIVRGEYSKVYGHAPLVIVTVSAA